MVEHTGETFDDDSSISKMLLDYGWAIPAAIGAGYIAKKGYDVYQGLKSRSITQNPQPSKSSSNQVIDVASREVPMNTATQTPIEAPVETVQQTPVETPKTKLAIEAEQKFGAPLADVENHFGVKITNLKDAEILTNNYKNSLPKGTVPAIPSGQQNIPTTTSGAFSQPSSYGQASNVAPEITKQPIEPTASPAPAPKTPTVVEPATVVSTGPTPEAAAAPIEKAAEVKKAVEPTGMKPTYNKSKKNPIGPGAYNWLTGQEGPKSPEVWKNLVGNKNVSYDQFLEQYKPVYEGYIGSYGEPDPFKQAAKPGEYRRPSMVPESIRGSSNLKGLAGLAGMSGLLMAASSPEAKAAMARASTAIKDIGISPEAILRGKGDELGRMGNAYVNAGNVNYLRDLQSQLQVEKDPERKQILLREIQKIGAVAPPSASMR